jgi:hypothetical protein
MSSFRADTSESKRRQRLTTPLLALPGVVGVGQSGRTLQIYLGIDTDETRRQVADVVDSIAPGMAFRCIVSGPFRAG